MDIDAGALTWLVRAADRARISRTVNWVDRRDRTTPSFIAVANGWRRTAACLYCLSPSWMGWLKPQRLVQEAGIRRLRHSGGDASKTELKHTSQVWSRDAFIHHTTGRIARTNIRKDLLPTARAVARRLCGIEQPPAVVHVMCNCQSASSHIAVDDAVGHVFCICSSDFVFSNRIQRVLSTRLGGYGF